MFAAFRPLVDTIYSVLDGPYDVATYVVAPLDALEMRLVNEQFACMCFLLDVDRRMGDVQHAWQAHKKRGILNVCVPTAVTNAVLRDVEMLFQALCTNRPYLQDMEHILALLMCGDALLEMVTRHAVSFNTAAGLLMVARRVQTPTLRRTALGILVHELHTTLLLALHADLREFITITQLQPNERIAVDPMAFGRPWNESEWRVSNTSELYQTFFANILPTFISHALQDGADAWLELEAGMMPFPNLVHEYVHTLTASFLLACQSLLWSILYTQGSLSKAISCAKVAKSTSIALARLSFQLERCRKNGDGLYVQPYVPINIDNALGWLTHRMLASAPSNSFAPFEMDRTWPGGICS
ncbi:hypothetical protein SPRG_01331 [Saprolegnia parasitica CBS 223.65]|uniref:Uncharacterized protein n=1 Tax=Saprolegnia parasitica (strain CBS 223.65) TaxID=695850 RepID=A0A067D4W7_SAPPC|nr:hypothetical protein SPRG_01331 [Saprolegnia parasitica CBS 223.65]KDO34057.1 hypothetical protein SPRG_01331 [Saprolegnia parasitica CBS 223.65]|eukprot:XP_012194941.1 hypothetical protein SPRG_01331 [Saprolegnia parasitica CBS 223.65]